MTRAGLETIALVLCVAMLGGLAVYTIDILVPGAGLVQEAEAIRRSTHQCVGTPSC